MKVFRLSIDERYRDLVPSASQAGLEALQRFNGTRIGGEWKPLKVEVDADFPDKLPLGDFAGLYVRHVPVFSRRAVETLDSLLIKNGELLSLKCDCGDYFAFNVTRLVDAMDTESSVVKYFPSGKIMDVRRYVLNPQRCLDAAIFKLPQVPLMDVFVTEGFVNLVERTGLTGFAFSTL